MFEKIDVNLNRSYISYQALFKYYLYLKNTIKKNILIIYENIIWLIYFVIYIILLMYLILFVSYYLILEIIFALYIAFNP